jgi:hypothetical protein
MGIVAGASSGGGVCLPIMFAHLVPRISFGWTLRAAALVFLGCFAAVICLTRVDHAPRAKDAKRKIFDFGGFRNVRYLVLAVANFIAFLGLYAPYNFAGMSSAWRLSRCTRAVADHLQNHYSSFTNRTRA